MNGTGTTTGWVSGSGDQPGHLATFTTRTTSYTAAASAAAPPRKHYNGVALMTAGPFLGLIVGIAGTALLAQVQLGGLGVVAAVLVALVVMIIGAAIFPKDMAYNLGVYPVQLERWSRSWSCQRCGQVFSV